METEVMLQSPYPFEWWVLALGILFVLLSVVPIVLFHLAHRPKTDPEPVEAPPAPVAAPRPRSIEEVRYSYLAQLSELERRVANRQVSVRDAYQELSPLLRNFIHDAGGPDMRDKTLSDIDPRQFPAVHALVAEYYEPEFALQSRPNIQSSIETTRRVISSWR